jgi:hypothetical protein
MEILVSLFGLLIPIIAIIATFSAIGIPLYHHIRTRHLERMALIEKGIVSEDVKYLYYKPSSMNNPYGYLKWGLILFFAGLGFLIPLLLLYFFDGDPALSLALVPIGVGIALLIYYRIALKHRDEGESV